MAAAHHIATRAVADGQSKQDTMAEVTVEDQPALDAALDELTGFELDTLTLAAELLAQRTRATSIRRRTDMKKEV